MREQDAASDFVLDMRINTVEQVSIRLAAALLGHWNIRQADPVEIHLEGESKIGKSTLVARTCTLLWGEHIYREAGFLHGGFDYETDSIEKNGIKVVSIDEGRRRFGWDYANNRCEVLREPLADKTVLFVENPCTARLDYKTGNELKTKPDIVMRLTVPIRQICQRLSDVDKALGKPAKITAHAGIKEAQENGWEIGSTVLGRLWRACGDFAKSSEDARRRVAQSMALRRIETVFDPRTFSADSPVVTAYKNNDVPLEQAWTGFRRMENRSIEALPRLPVFRWTNTDQYGGQKPN